MYQIAKRYKISEGYCCKIIKKTEAIIMKDNSMRLTGRKKLSMSPGGIKEILVDVTEVNIERPKKRQKQYYSGKKKRHTLKIQVAATQEGTILCVYTDKGRKHDFRLYKESKLRLSPNTLLIADSGYTGIDKYHSYSLVPKRRKKNTPLSQEDKKNNHEINSKRVKVEHVINHLKRFKILSTRYRNRRKRFRLRVTLIAILCNMNNSL